MCESTQRALAEELQDHLLFGRNEAPLHHYHQTFHAAVGMPPLERMTETSPA